MILEVEMQMYLKQNLSILICFHIFIFFASKMNKFCKITVAGSFCLPDWLPLLVRFWSRSYITFFSSFPIFAVQFECFITYKKITDSKMTQLISEKRRNSTLAKKKSFIGLATAGYLDMPEVGQSNKILLSAIL